MSTEAIIPIQIIEQPASDGTISSSKAVKSDTFVDRFCNLQKTLPGLKREYIFSLGFSGSFLLVGVLFEHQLMMEVGGLSFCLAAKLRRQYLDAKLEHKNLKAEIKAKRIVFWGDFSHIS